MVLVKMIPMAKVSNEVFIISIIYQMLNVNSCELTVGENIFRFGRSLVELKSFTLDSLTIVGFDPA